MRSRRGLATAKLGEDGFTLLEIMLALAMTAMLFVAMNTFIFSMSELWGRNSDRRLFAQHVDAVTRYLANTLRGAALPPAARANATPISATQITPLNGPIDYLVTFDLLSGTRILSWPDSPLPEVTCSLQFRDHEGLFLLWHSRLETNYSTDPPRELLLTPFVTRMQYDYYDGTFNRWTTYATLQNDPTTNLPTPPQRIRLTFTYGKLKKIVTVPVPTAPQGLPNFTW